MAEQSRVDLIMQLVEAGLTPKAIARRLGVSVRTVNEDIRKALGTANQRRRTLGEPELEKARQMREQGATLQQAADELGCHLESLRRSLRQGPAGPYRVLSDEEHKMVRQLHAEGLSARQIGGRMQRSPASVMLSMRKQRLPVRQGSSRVTQDEQQKIEYMAARGISAPVIAKQLGRSLDTVQRHIVRRFGTIGHKRLTDAEKDRIAALHAEGRSTTYIMALMHCSQDTVKRDRAAGSKTVMRSHRRDTGKGT